MQQKWIPTTLKEIKSLEWDYIDVILFSGDAYVDHPSFANAVLARFLESLGLHVAIVPQPNWQDDLRDFKKLGKPRLFFGVSAGNMDSMVNHYTANKRLRSNDAYTPAGAAGFRPDYPTIKYSNILKDIFPDIPVVIGGVEASLRRLTHYDYWQDKLLPSILIESKADMLVYGMGEKPIEEIVKKLKAGKKIQELKSIRQTAYIESSDNKLENDYDKLELFSFEDCVKDKIKHAKNFKIIETESNTYSNTRLIQKAGTKKVIVNPAFHPSSTEELDRIYNLPYTRLPHPKYRKKKPIPAYDMIRHSVNIHRGCFGGCSFCTISAHQGKFISSRSENSILKELKAITEMHDFKGYVSDLGGPSANMYRMRGKDIEICKKCKRASCIHPNVCKNLNSSPKPLTDLYKKAAQIKDIKKVFIGSGVRYDLFIPFLHIPEYKEYATELIRNHVSGRLKVAPEHTENTVLEIMRKPPLSMFHKLKRLFDDVNNKYNLKQQLIPYFISSHPGCKNEAMAELSAYTKDMNFRLEQIQDFTPTPMTLATAMYYTGVDPYTLKKVYTAKTKEQKLAQRQFFFWYKKEYKNGIMKELRKIGRDDLIKKLFNSRK